MKKVLSGFLALIMAFGIFCSVPFTESPFKFTVNAKSVDDLSFRLNGDKKSYYVSDCKTSASGDLTIPSTYYGLPVTSIDDSAFYGCTSLTSVTIGNGVTSIGEYAFYNCTNLASVTIPNSVTSIGRSAFYGCTNLASVTIGNGVTSIPYRAFYGCTSLTSVTIGNGVTSIGEDAFYNCTSLASVTIPDSVTSIDWQAFYNCTSLATVTIGNGVTSIGWYAFGDCTSLSDVYYSGKQNEWNDIFVEDGNTGLKNARIHYSVTDSANHWNGTSKEPTCTEDGFKNATCSCGYSVNEVIEARHTFVDGICTVCQAEEIVASSHPYENYTDKSWIIERSGAEFIRITFSDNTKTESGYDYICIYDKNNELVGKYSGTELAGVTLKIEGDKVKIRLTSDSSSTEYGFEITKIRYARVGQPCSHSSVEWVVDKEATVTAEGSKHTECTVCGEILKTESIAKLPDPLETPKLAGISNLNGGVYFKWNTVSGADGYYIYRKVGNGNWEKLVEIEGGSKNAYTDASAKAGYNYTYTVAAYKGTTVGSYDTNGLYIKRLTTPKLVSVSNLNNGIYLKWNSVYGASGYQIYRKVGNGGWVKIATLSGGSKVAYTDTTAKAGYNYKYTVRAYFGNVLSYYNTNGLAIKRLTTPKLVSVSNLNNGVYLKWNSVYGASGYQIYRKTGNGGWVKIATVSGGSKVAYTDTTAKSGYNYKYTVRAYYGTSLSYYNTTGLAIKRLIAPKLTGVTSAKAGVTVKWNKTYGATGYQVYRKTGNGGWVKIATVSGGSKVSYLDKTAKKGVTYTYTVRAYYGSSLSYYNTAGLKITDRY